MGFTFSPLASGAVSMWAIRPTDGTDGIVINPGAYAHYSYAIHDALRSIRVPAVEVHISDISAREPWRHTSVTAPACVTVIAGQGFPGYLLAIDTLEAMERQNV